MENREIENRKWKIENGKSPSFIDCRHIASPLFPAIHMPARIYPLPFALNKHPVTSGLLRSLTADLQSYE
jgi:hypothetical protein